MLDHVIVGQPFDGRLGYFSFKEAGILARKIASAKCFYRDCSGSEGQLRSGANRRVGLQQVFENQHHIANAILALHLEVDLGSWLLLQLLTQGRDCKGRRIGLVHFQNSFANL
jgi:hypothetical protein